MDFVIIVVVILIAIIVLKYVFSCKLKKLKKLGEDEELDNLASSYPSNVEICKEYLKKLKNENVKIYERPSNELTEAHNFAIRETSYRKLEELKNKYGLSIYKLTNIAIYNAINM